MRLLVFCGKRRSGKTTAAEICVDMLGEQGVLARKKALADPLKDMFAKKLGMDPLMLSHPSYKEDFREGMQKFSSEIKKDNPNFFNDLFFEDILPGETIVCDDLRLDTELELFIARKASIYKIECNPKVLEFHGWRYTPGVDDTMYENQCASYSAFTYHCLGGGRVFNNGSIDKLRDELVPVIESFLSRNA